MTDCELLEIVAVLKHDLGKYSSWISANLGDVIWEGPPSPELLGALTADLLRTRSRGPETPESAWEVWDRLAARLPRPLPAPELVAVEAAVATLRRAEPMLRAGDLVGLGEQRGAVRAAQRRVRSELQGLHRRLLRAREAVPLAPSLPEVVDDVADPDHRR